MENENQAAAEPSEFNVGLGVMALAGTYSPLYLQFSGWPESQRRWTLSFQQRPTNEIILTGDEPTRDEIIKCLIHTQAPIWMIGVCEVAAAVAKRDA